MITNSDFHDNTSNGVGMGSGAPLLSAIDIVDSTFSHNGIVASGHSVNGSGDISLFNFQGNALIKNVTVHGGDTAVSNLSNANFGIQVAGYDPSTHDVIHAIGNVVFDNVSVTGAYSKTLLFVQGYTDLDGLTFLNTGTNLNGSAGWGVAAAIDPTIGLANRLRRGRCRGARTQRRRPVAPHRGEHHPFVDRPIPPIRCLPTTAWRWERCSTARRSPTRSSAPAGNDVIAGGAGNDTLDGGAGADTHERRRRQRHLRRRQCQRRGRPRTPSEGTDMVQSVASATRSAPMSRT